MNVARRYGGNTTGMEAIRRWSPVALAVSGFVGIQVLCAVLARVYGYNPLATATWERWDSAFYLRISERGYELSHCLADKPTFWCGTTGWFPGLSWLMNVAGLLQAPRSLAGIFLVLMCWFGILWVLAITLERSRCGLVAFAAACVFPGSIYLHALFPLSPLLLCALLAFHAAISDKFRLAALFSMLAATMYPVGILVGPSVVLACSGRKRWLVVVGTVIGFGLVLLVQHRQTGHWNGYWLMHTQAEEGMHNPFDTLGARIKPLINKRYHEPVRVWTAMQTLLVTCFMIWVVANARRFWREGGRTRIVLVYCVAAWLLPMFAGGNVTFARSECALLPAVFLVQRMPMRVAFAALLPLLVMFAGSEWLFLTKELV